MTSTIEYKLSDLFKHLKFDFRDAVKHTAMAKELEQKRITYHRTIESSISQIAFVLHYYYHLLEKTQSFASYRRPRRRPSSHQNTNLNVPDDQDTVFFPSGTGRRSPSHSIVRKPSDSNALDENESISSCLNEIPAHLLSPKGRIKVGILLPDLFPESSELMCNLILQMFLNDLSFLKEEDIVVMSRRGPRMTKRLYPEFQSVRCEWDWSSPSILASFDFVVIVSTNLHAPLVRETINTQTDPYSTTLFMFICGGITRLRAQNIVRSDHVLLPFFLYDAKPTDSSFEQRMVPGSDQLAEKFARGVCVPELNLVRQVFEQVLVEKGINQAEAKSAIQKTLPKTEIDAIEAFDQLKLPRLTYNEPTIQGEIEDPVKQIEKIISCDRQDEPEF